MAHLDTLLADEVNVKPRAEVGFAERQVLDSLGLRMQTGKELGESTGQKRGVWRTLGRRVGVWWVKEGKRHGRWKLTEAGRAELERLRAS